jgi:hypothetical protein
VALVEPEAVPGFVCEDRADVVVRRRGRRLVEQRVRRVGVDEDVRIEHAAGVAAVGHDGDRELLGLTLPVADQVQAVGRPAVVVSGALRQAGPQHQVRYARKATPGIERHVRGRHDVTRRKDRFQRRIHAECNGFHVPAKVVAALAGADAVGEGGCRLSEACDGEESSYNGRLHC